MSLLFLAGCGGGTTPTVSTNPTPTPTITTISPNSVMAGAAAFTLTINGTNFVAASTVNFGGTAPATTFVSSAQLTAAISAAAIVSAGTEAVTVTNPPPSTGTSNAVNFTITSGSNLAPFINSLSPSCAPPGEPAFDLLVNGQNFVAGSSVRWNGTDRPTTFLDTSRLDAQISATDIAAAGTAAVTVFNPAPGGGISNTSTFTITTGGVDPQSIALDPVAGKFAYVADTGCPDAFAGFVSMYTINPTTGALATIGPPAPTHDEGARAVTVDPFGKFAYVVNWGEGDTAGSITTYTINANTGALTQTGMINGECPGLCAPFSIAVDPSGKFAYVADQGGFAPTGVSMYTINATTGALTSIGTITAGSRAISVAVDRTGKFAYVVTNSDAAGSPGAVSMYTINAAGALTSIGTITAGTNPVSVAADPAGNFAYVTNSGSNNVSMYGINATTGALTSMGTISAGSSPTSIAIHRSGQFAYVTNSGSNNISMYSINTATGALTLIGTVGT